jgi:TPR repeat protein
MLLDGRGVARDPAAAFHWFRRAAEIGSIDGINMVGRCYELGWGVAVDHAEAVRWYRKAAAKSSDWGLYNLASMFLYGEGIQRDRVQALELYVKAASLGHAKAMGMVGRFHEEGWEVLANPAKALTWYGQAAKAGDFWGQYHLARLIADSHPDEALTWLARAVEGGTLNFLRSVGPTLLNHVQASFREAGLRALERCCESNGVEDCYAYGRALAACGRNEKATLWLRPAARHGHEDAQRTLLKIIGKQEQPTQPLVARFTKLLRRSRPQQNELVKLHGDLGS